MTARRRVTLTVLTRRKGKVLVQKIARYKDAIKDCEYQLSTTHARIEAVLDVSGVKETTTRQMQHSEFVSLTDNNAALGRLSAGVRLVQSPTELWARQSVDKEDVAIRKILGANNVAALLA